jgi:hypothetical protein
LFIVNELLSDIIPRAAGGLAHDSCKPTSDESSRFDGKTPVFAMNYRA